MKFANLPVATTLLKTCPKGAKHVYNILLEKPKKSNVLSKWENKIPSDIPWDKIFLKTRYIHEVKLKWFQLRITYRILVTNTTLYEMRLRTNNLCCFCSANRDSIYHYLWDCPVIQIFWEQFVNLLKDKCINCDRLQLSPTLVLFGEDNTNKTDNGFDFILLHAKYFIYLNHIKNQLPSIQGFIAHLENVQQIDKYASRINMSTGKYNKRWVSYESIFT